MWPALHLAAVMQRRPGRTALYGPGVEMSMVSSAMVRCCPAARRPSSGISGFSHVASGNAHVLALKIDGTVWAWGYGGMGALGNGATANVTAPIQVQGITGAIAIAAGYHFSLALKSDGTVWAWGSNGVEPTRRRQHNR